MRQILPAEIGPSRLRELVAAAEAHPQGVDLQARFADAKIGYAQVWEFDSGIMLTRVLCHPKGKELWVDLVAGRDYIKNFDAVCAGLSIFAHANDCKWIGGNFTRKALKKLYSFWSDEHMETTIHAKPLDVAHNTGLLAEVLIKTPEGSVRAEDVRVGLEVVGPKGPQTVVAVYRFAGDSVTGVGIGSDKLIKVEGDWIRSAEHSTPRQCVGVQYSFECLPDHEFNLVSGETLHNGGGGGDTVVNNDPWGEVQPYLRGLFQRADTAFNQSYNASGMAPVQRTGGSSGPGTGPGFPAVQQSSLFQGIQNINNRFGNPINLDLFTSQYEGLGNSGAGVQGGGVQGNMAKAGQPNLSKPLIIPNPSPDPLTLTAQGGVNPQTAALQSQLLAAQTAGVGAAETRDLGMRTLQGEFLDAESNPYLQSAIEAAFAPVMDQYTRNIIPGLQSQAIGLGAYGGSREAILQANTANDVTRNLANTAGQISYENYVRERQNQMLAPQMIQQGVGMSLQPGQILQGVSNTQQALPFNALNQYAALLGYGNIGGTQTTSGGGASPIQGALGGAATGAALGSVIPGLGTTIGAIGGGLLGAFG